MTRILSYNILVGGTRRVDQLTTVIRSVDPDVVGLAEATDPKVVEELAARLGMQFRLSGYGTGAKDWQLADLSRLPILHTQVHTRPVFTRKYLLEVGVEAPGGELLTVFVIHQTANFHRGSESNRIRRAEVQEILQIMAAHKGTPHLVMGDFNSLAPGDSLQASVLLRYMIRQHDTRQKLSTTFYPRSWSKFRRTLFRHTISVIVNNKIGSSIIDRFSPIFARGGIDLLLQAGYVDCVRQLHPHEQAFTCPSVDPAGRIDFIFASPELAAHLCASNVVPNVPDIQAHEASDHLAVYADFQTP